VVGGRERERDGERAVEARVKDVAGSTDDGGGQDEEHGIFNVF